MLPHAQQAKRLLSTVMVYYTLHAWHHLLVVQTPLPFVLFMKQQLQQQHFHTQMFPGATRSQQDQ